MILKEKNILVIISGGIAVYKVCELIRLLKKKNCNVKVIMTKNATRFVSPLTIQTLSQNRVFIDTFESEKNYDIEHISLAEWADIVVVAPATANIIGKFCNGIADDLATTTLLAVTCPILLVPAMNSNMFNNFIVQGNIERLRKNGINFIEPDEGLLACGVYGKGRYPSNEDIVFEIERILTKKDFNNLRVLVTAGPTREYIDPVRYITNKSSGKMGYFIAEEAFKRGAYVKVISGPVNINIHGNIDITYIERAEQMFEEVKKCINDFDIFISAAAIADFRPKETLLHKLKKEDKDEMLLQLDKNPDILHYVGHNKNENQIVIGFAAETENILENAYKKLERKNADAFVVNNVLLPNAGFDVDTNIVTIISRHKIEEIPLLSKKEVANKILDFIKNYLCR